MLQYPRITDADRTEAVDFGAWGNNELFLLTTDGFITLFDIIGLIVPEVTVAMKEKSYRKPTHTQKSDYISLFCQLCVA